jgi:hypothetical protein
MTIEQINVSSEALQAGKQIRTSDGKIVTLKHACFVEHRVCLDGLQKNQKVETFSGDVLYFLRKQEQGGWPYIFSEKPDGHGGYRTYTRDGIYSSTQEPSGDDIAEVLPYEAPRVSIEGARKGDRFRLRNGEIFIYEGEKNGDGCLKGVSGVTSGRYFWFTPNGEARPLGSNYDVIEVIPAPKPEFADVLRRVIRAADVDIQEVVVSYGNWKAIPKQYPHGDNQTYFEGVRLLYNNGVPASEIKLQLKPGATR